MKKVTPAEFLKELKAYDAEKYKIATTLRELIRKDKHTTEEIKYGGLLYSRPKPYTGIFVYKDHVSMEFTEGASFKDPKKLLEGSGKFRRHLKFTTAADIKKAVVNDFLKQSRHNLNS